MSTSRAARGPSARVRKDTVRPLAVVRAAADSLLARSRAMAGGGRAWRSAIQAPHFQTDRDVGAAGIGAGLLAAFAVTRDPRYLTGAEAAGDFLLGASERVDGGLRWPDWADPDGTRSATHYTSFDDGAAGISDFLWRLFDATRQERFRSAALAGMHWLVAQAEGASCPAETCSWRWTDDPASSVAYDGVGMGQAGIVLALDAFADRTGDPTFRSYARAGAARLRLLVAGGTRPLPRASGDGSTLETGYLSGSAGAALVFLERYAHDRDARDLAAARGLLRWVNGRALLDGPGRASWSIATGDAAQASGFELGVAGIAWVDLHAYLALHDPAYRTAARRAAAWLRSVATDAQAWAETPGPAYSPFHIGLDSGTAGVGWVLEDIARSGIDPGPNAAIARAALAGVAAAAGRDRLGAFWYENRTAGVPGLPGEPSWHWGAAGIAAFAARVFGWTDCNPGGQPLLCGPARPPASSRR